MKTKKIAILSLLPVSATGGGENYTLNCIKSISCDETENECDLIAPIDNGFIYEKTANRFNYIFSFSKWRKLKILEEYPLTFSQVLDIIPGYSFIWIHQYLACQSVYDILNNTHSHQYVIFTNLGFEANNNDFWIRYNQLARQLFLEISQFSTARIKKHTQNVNYVYAGVWKNHINTYEFQNKDKNLFVSIGRILPHKGFEIAIDALTNQLLLTIIGPYQDNDYLHYLKMKSSSKNVIFTGRIISSERDNIISKSIGLIANSATTTYHDQKFEHSELLGLVILEAICNYTLPITSDQPALKEIMNILGLRQFIYKERDVKDLRQKMKKLTALSSDEYDKMIENSLAIIKEKFLWENYWHRVKQIIVND